MSSAIIALEGAGGGNDHSDPINDVQDHTRLDSDEMDVLQNSKDESFEGKEEDDEDNNEDEDNDDDDDEIPSVLHGFGSMPSGDIGQWTISLIQTAMNSTLLDLNPHYQCGVVWPKAAMSFLVDSIWKGFYIPPIILKVKQVPLADGTTQELSTCIDGKQRLTAIYQFLNGKVPLKLNGKNWYFCDDAAAQTRTSSVLPQSAKDRFLNLYMIVVEYEGISDAQKVELFNRVQLGKPVTPAEMLQGTQGSWQDFAKLFEQKYADVMGLLTQRRSSGFRLLLTCFAQILECLGHVAGNQVPSLKQSKKQIEAFCSNAAAYTPQVESDLCNTFDLFADLAVKDRETFEDYKFEKAKNFAPTEMVAVCCLLALRGGNMEEMDLLESIAELRVELRNAHRDLRLNQSTWTTAWEFISNL